MLQAIDEFSVEDVTVWHRHDPNTLFLSLRYELSSVLPTIRPEIGTLSTDLAILTLANVFLSIGECDDTLSMKLVIDKLSAYDLAIWPALLSVAMLFPILPVPIVDLTICKDRPPSTVSL